MLLSQNSTFRGEAEFTLLLCKWYKKLMLLRTDRSDHQRTVGVPHRDFPAENFDRDKVLWGEGTQEYFELNCGGKQVTVHLLECYGRKNARDSSVLLTIEAGRQSPVQIRSHSQDRSFPFRMRGDRPLLMSFIR